MKKNMGIADRVIRILIAAVIAVLFFATDILSGTLGTILLVLAVVFAATSMVSWCGLYALFGIKTCKVSSES